ncbi:autotransporter domain-containing protein [Croceicoccus sp. Ery15]|uniref:autotransporter domain-containing protein n=1 Tax=Croceicoccus sp. Ery15 TaxID=1703338 RepID=UPI001E563656|nr:autotransporter domain-containing protein [Croceicoccus sp. Ery15]
MSHMQSTRHLAAIGGGILVLAAAPTGHAQSLDNDYWINVQAYYPKVDTNVRVTAETANEVGTDIDLEKDLDLDNRDFLPAVSIGSRFGKVVVGFDFFKLKRNGEKSLEREIEFDDVTYPVNAGVRSGFDSDVYRLTVGYSFVQQPDLEIGAALGVHATDFTVSIEGEVGAGELDAQSEARRRSVLAPLPTVGLYGTWRVADRLEANGRIDYLSLSIDDYDGKLINAQAGLNYSITDNVALGVAYRYVEYRLGVDKDNWNGRIRYRLSGPAVIAQASF